ncbi:MAG: DUF664 domain-containing protein [Acidimicrobiales bacterium]
MASWREIEQDSPDFARHVRDRFPSPTIQFPSRAEVFIGYLDYFRARIIAKVGGLGDAEQRHSRLPTGWTPLELVKHLMFVELRWLEWGFEGRRVDDPWGDRRDDRWYVTSDETTAELAKRIEGPRAAYINAAAKSTPSASIVVGQCRPMLASVTLTEAP